MFNKFNNRPNKNYNQNNLLDQSLPSYKNPELERLILEIKENRRRINNLAKRIVRLENYLRIRDTNDYSIIDDSIANEEKDYFK